MYRSALDQKNYLACLVREKNNIKGVLHFLPQKASKLASFVLYLKIVNIFSKNDIWILQ